MDESRTHSAPVMDAKLVPPSTLLPPIRKALELQSEDISRFIAELGRIYTPEVLGTRFEVVTPARPVRKTKGIKGVLGGLSVPVADSGYASLVASDDEDEDGKHTVFQQLSEVKLIPFSGQDSRQSNALTKAVQTLAQDLTKPHVSDALEEELTLLRADEFERSYAMRWLTGLIARSAEWVELGAEDEDDEPSESNEYGNRERVVEKASALLAACSGTSASGALTRSFAFHPRLSGQRNGRPRDSPVTAQIQVHLKDDSLPSQDHTAVGLQTWGSAPILAQLISDRPSAYGLDLAKRFNGNEEITASQTSATFRVLELGAGTGLLSLFTWRLLEHQLKVLPSQPGGIPLPQCSVLATDYHPSVLSNLNFNLGLNAPSTPNNNSQLSASIDAQLLDWNSCTPLDEADRFDVVYGADIIYEQEHAQLVKGVVEMVLKRPSSRTPTVESSQRGAGYLAGGIFWLISPLRPTHEVETRSIETVFGEVIDKKRWPENVYTAEEDWQLGLLELRSLSRRKGIGRADEVSYRVLKIGWVSA